MGDKPQLDTFMAGQLVCFRVRDGEEVADGKVLVEVTDTSAGKIEFAFNDRDERVYLKLPIDRVLANIPAKHKKPCARSRKAGG